MNKTGIENKIVDKVLEVIKSKMTFDYLSINGYYQMGFGASLPIYKDGEKLEISLDEFVEFYGLLDDDFQKYFSELHSNNIQYNLPQWNTVNFEIKSNGQYISKYWYDEEHIKSDALRIEKDFSHAMANHLVNHYLFVNVKFKRKFERIIWTFWIKDGLPYFALYSINKKNQKLPIELDGEYSKYAKKTLLHHYEVTQNGILKDVWKPWNKIIISIPPNGYLNENEDIEYYLDDVKLEKDFFLRGY